MYFEILDGLQRMNAIVSFIEGDTTLDGLHFDLDAFAFSKSLKDQGLLMQKEPVLDRATSVSLAKYALPVSVYAFKSVEEIDEIFRRINSFGRQLSRQELRQAGATGPFAELVRRISSQVRNDASATDQLTLKAMATISISQKRLGYGVAVEDIFWVKESILDRGDIRESKDEELVANLLGYMLSESPPPVSQEVLNELYSEDHNNSRYSRTVAAIQLHGSENVTGHFLFVHNEMRKILDAAGERFATLILSNPAARIPKYYQVVFLALYELLVRQRLDIATYPAVANALKGIGDSSITINRSAKWNARPRQMAIESVVGVLRRHFIDRKRKDPATASWLTEFENLLFQSRTEQSLYDFKQGAFLLSDPPQRDPGLIPKVAETLCAMANLGPEVHGYVILGVAGTQATAARVKDLFGAGSLPKNGFHVVGIDHEAAAAGTDIDGYNTALTNELRAQPIDPDLLPVIMAESRTVLYEGKTVVIFAVKALTRPVLFGGKYFTRDMSNNRELTPTDMPALFARFSR